MPPRVAQDGVFEGLGTFSFANGVYEGQWVDGKMEGRGKFNYYDEEDGLHAGEYEVSMFTSPSHIFSDSIMTLCGRNAPYM